jgi:GDP-mannose 6-dehydrogenase
MSIFCQDTKLNLSPYYMKPGFAFGGSCLPKDVRALNYKAKALDLNLPIISSIMENNQKQIDRGFEMITRQGNRKITFLGFSFKAGTDDLRESPIVELIERLIGKGYDLKLYDKNVSLAKLVGANKDYILTAIPHISKLMVDNLEAAVSHGETIVIGNRDEQFQSILPRLAAGKVMVDLVRITEQRSEEGRYDGICW